MHQIQLVAHPMIIVNLQWKSSNGHFPMVHGSCLLLFANPTLDSGFGYMFECNFTLPYEFHAYYSDFPLWPLKFEIIITKSKKNFSDYSSADRVITIERNILSFLTR